MGKMNGITRKLIVFWQKYITGSYDKTPDWLLLAKKKGATHLLEVWDSFEMEEFAFFVMPGDNLEKIKEKYNSHPTTRVSKVIPIEY
ncbi:MAG: hypothetical protein Q8N14_04910 [Candidatus Omnitrophota bacterium]|nr:hypothetical protein [Candidatus Omnitrophota bacterium]